jgi:macrocin-O-methyltransferase TylF-like protien
MKDRVKEAATLAGARMPVGVIRSLNGLVNYLEVGRWLRERGFEVRRRLPTREDVFAAVVDEIGDVPVLYLEFGVHRGESLRSWSRLLRHPESRLHGFDSFEGLPETWSFAQRAGHFSTGGTPPTFADERVTLFKGWFEDTLPTYELPPHERLVVAIDSDLYSSAAFVLGALEEQIALGTYLYFDEFQDRSHELRAFADFLDRTRMRFRLVAATRELAHVVFVREE